MKKIKETNKLKKAELKNLEKSLKATGFGGNVAAQLKEKLKYDRASYLSNQAFEKYGIKHSNQMDDVVTEILNSLRRN
jgi:hypothetical protein